jgi:hypothetical protein
MRVSGTGSNWIRSGVVIRFSQNQINFKLALDVDHTDTILVSVPQGDCLSLRRNS